MKIFTGIISGVTSLMMTATFAGCAFSNKPEENKSERKGGYVEETIESGENDNLFDLYSLFSEFTQKSDATEFYNIRDNKLYSLSKGENNFKGEISDNIKDKIAANTIIHAAVSPNGDYLLCLSTYSDANSIVYISSDGSEHRIESDEIISSAEFTSDNRLFVATYGEVYEVSTTNFTLKPVCDTGYLIDAFDIVGNNIIVVDENGVKIYDYINKKEVESPEALNNFFENYTNSNNIGEISCDICSDDKNNMYILTSDGIFRYTVNGNQIEKILDGIKYQIGNPDNEINSLTYLDDGSFYVSFKNGLLIKYYYDPELVNEKSSVLKIYSLQKNDTLSQIIRDYSVANKNTEVDYLVGMRNGVTYEDALKNLTTQILSGNTPDVILLDGLDIDNYIDKNMLLDLSVSETQWNKDGKLLKNITAWNNRDGKIYSLACKFRIPAIGAAQKDLEKINEYSDIADYVEKIRNEINPDCAVLYMGEPGIVVKNALIYEGSKLVAAGDIGREKLREFYNNCARVYKNDQPEGSVLVGGINGTISDEYSFANNLILAIADTGGMALGTLNSFENDVNYATSIDNYKKNTDFQFRYGLNSESKVFIPECNLGIIENGKNHKDAVTFISQALNFETQKTDHNDGLPVNTDTLDFFYSKNENVSNNDSVNVQHFSTGKEDKWIIEPMSAKEVSEFDSYIRNLSDPLYIDGITSDIIVNEGIKCLEGSITADQAADDVVSKLELKMKE